MDVQLYEPDGTPNTIVSQAYAIEWCKQYPGWSWAFIDGEEYV
jgi:hypothetical protein